MEQSDNQPHEGQEPTPEQETPTPSKEQQPEKPERTPEEQLAYYERRAQQLRKKLNPDEPAPAKQPEKQSSELDYGQLAFLTAKGIDADEEVALVHEAMASTGKSLKDVLNNEYFKAELKAYREAKAAKEAVPSGTKRSTQTARDTVEYWVAKGELPPADNVQLRRDVVKAKLKAASSGSKFTQNSVVS